MLCINRDITYGVSDGAKLGQELVISKNHVSCKEIWSKIRFWFFQKFLLMFPPCRVLNCFNKADKMMNVSHNSVKLFKLLLYQKIVQLIITNSTQTQSGHPDPIIQWPTSLHTNFMLRTIICIGNESLFTIRAHHRNEKIWNCMQALTARWIGGADRRDNKPDVNEKSRKSKAAEIGRKAEFCNYLN